MLSEDLMLAGAALSEKLEKLWVTPIISNKAFYQGVEAHRPKNPVLGEFLRVVSWNIEKSIELKNAVTLLTGTSTDFLNLVDRSRVETGTETYKKILLQRERLQKADVLILQEMDIGVKRSGYVNAPAELASALNMNYAYAPAYLEIDPVLLGEEKIEFEDGGIDTEATSFFAADPARFKGVFGSAVLSRYPIKYVEVFPLKTQPYDWYSREKQKTGFTENTRRKGTKALFKNEMTREIKVGGRNLFRVDLEVPGLPNNTLTVINVHLEIKCKPKGRDAQMAEILSYIKNIHNPLIMMGDYNAAPTDISPTSLKKIAADTAKDPTAWLSLGLHAVTPHATALNVTRGASNITKNLNDPFAKDVKVVAPNPVKPMFQRIRSFRFDDETAFDFRGDTIRSIGEKSKLLANSNQRGQKGFKTTFSVKRAIGIVGKYRLDWVFVRSGYLTDPDDKSSPYKLAPHFGETLEELNTGLKTPISDHHPNVVDLPFSEPNIFPKDFKTD